MKLWQICTSAIEVFLAMFQHLTGRIKNKVTTAEKVRPLPDKASNVCVWHRNSYRIYL